ncbi:Sodium channel protein Nach-like Protein [Tribolium castaneum]|uniref:Sodium channel protein Nach-like Protein n=2 Tax=Tribolium castaneum TaxID=7070 RepID=D2A5I2_TRICA|nr:Sodium channel protein Nach-like Protein [Tribolium castaneum]
MANLDDYHFVKENKLWANRTSIKFSEAFKLAKFFGNFYDFDFNIADENHYKHLQGIVDVLELDIATLMKQFTTRCPDLLLNCRWKGVEKKCNELFTMKLTYDGFCCTFNYFKESLMNGSVSILNGTDGLTRGLSVTVMNDLDDYFYTPLESQGVTVQIFVPNDYPDKPSGSLSEVVVNVGTENYVKITPTTIFSTKEVMKYAVAKRQCLFDEERPTTFEGLYSQSDCNVDCRIASALALCHCLPFTIPLSEGESVCNFQDLKCLNQYKNKWNTLYPDNDDFGILQHEQHDSLRCEQRCYPSCDSTLYEVFPDSSPFHKKGNFAIIHIYYTNRFSRLFKHDVVYNWFEILSNFGGTFGIIVGFSVISVIECLVFVLQFTKKKCFT